MSLDKSPRTIHFPLRTFRLERPVVMGILNLTPDSFYGQSRWKNVDHAILLAEKMLSEGADIIDIGAQSTRPGAERIDAKTEEERLIPTLVMIRKEFPKSIISVDTFYSSVAKIAFENGADMINDVSGGTIDDKMFETAAACRVPYVLMHIKGEPQTMQHSPTYENVLAEVKQYFAEKIDSLHQLGVNDIIIDPGFGFGKTTEHNLQLMNGLDQLSIFGLPIMVGISRKKTIQNVLEVSVENTLNGTTVLNTIALMRGARILRVHDVREAVETVKLVAAVENQDL